VLTLVSAPAGFGKLVEIRAAYRDLAV